MVHNLSLYRKILKGIFTASASIIVTNSFMINRYYHYRPSSSSSTIRINNNNNNQKLYYSSSTINEWREKQFDEITEVDNVLASIDNKSNNHHDDSNNNGSFSSTILPREICIMPLSCENVLLQGETKQLHLNKEK